MQVEGFWRFTLSEDTPAAEIELKPALLLLHRGHVRSMDLAPTSTGHYRINGVFLTCFLRSFVSWSHPRRPIYQLVGQIEAELILLVGTCDEHPQLKFGARLARPKLSATAEAAITRA